MERVNCYKCKHFFVTYEPKRPYGCRVHGFKGPHLPSLTVFQSSGIQCQLFEEKRINK